MSGRVRTGFTLIELLVVIGIIAVVSGMIVLLPQGDKRAAAVRSSAEELAATLRLARSIAVDRRVVCGVAFNISNGAGTSGRVLNNRDGGHWYRIVGETALRAGGAVDLATYPIADFNDVSVQGRGNVAQFLQLVQAAWIGDAHGLPRKRVRFLALTDQDDGSGGWVSAGRFPATYPRPWFGWYDGAGTRRLYPWGGYDPALLDPAGRACSGFYYQGDDGPLAGSSSTADRFTTHLGAASPVAPVPVFQAGVVRPLVNAAWLDYVIVFLPDGTVREQAPMRNRRQSWWRRGPANAQYSAGGTGTGDLGPYTALAGSGVSADQGAMTSYWAHTGRLSVTLCPDAERDIDTFATAQQALDTLWPACRVTISRLGDIQVVPVSRRIPADAVIDRTSITDWQVPAQITARYRGFIATNADGTRRGRPITGFLSPEILAGRQWWLE